MDGSQFDQIVRALATPRGHPTSRRSVLGGLLGLGAGLLGGRAALADRDNQPRPTTSCPPGQVRRNGRCWCALTGGRPVNGRCPCPAGQTDTGDGRGCLECRSAAECPAGDACTSYVCEAGACRTTATVCDDGLGACTTKTCHPAAGCVFEPIACDDGNECTIDGCSGGYCTHVPNPGASCAGGTGTCNSLGICQTCFPDCTYKCGGEDDGCGGTCDASCAETPCPPYQVRTANGCAFPCALNPCASCTDAFVQCVGNADGSHVCASNLTYYAYGENCPVTGCPTGATCYSGAGGGFTCFEITRLARC